MNIEEQNKAREFYFDSDIDGLHCTITNTVELNYLDLLNHRDISGAIAERLGVVHQSPQLIVIKNGKAIAHASHEGINELQLSQFI